MKVYVAALLLLFAIFFSSTEDVFAESVREEAISIEAAAVNLYCRIKTAGRTYSTSGSGVFIHENGTILTNAHVAQYFLLPEKGRTTARCMVRTGSPAGDQYRATLVYLSPDWARNIIESTTKNQPGKGTGEFDFALLRVTEAKRGNLPDEFPAISLNVGTAIFEDGDEVLVAGYPSAGLGYKSIQNNLMQEQVTTKITAIQSFEHPHQDVLALAPSHLSASGVSGGPIALPSQELVGIATTVQSSRPSDDGRSLRAITIAYVDRALRGSTGFALVDYAAFARFLELDADTVPYTDLAQTIEKTLRNTR